LISRIPTRTFVPAVFSCSCRLSSMIMFIVRSEN
jgi:hypothetical protein